MNNLLGAETCAMTSSQPFKWVCRRMGVPQECPPSGGMAAHTGESSARPHSPPLLPPASHLRAPPCLPPFPLRSLPQGIQHHLDAVYAAIYC